MSGKCVLIAFMMLLSMLARADEYTGIWSEGPLRVVIFNCGNSYTGQIEQGGAVFPFRGAKVENDVLRGQFQHQRAQYGFSLAPAGEQGDFTSGTRTSKLKRETWDPFVATGELIEKQDYPAMWAQLQPLVDENQPHALYVAGLAHSKGWGVAASIQKANDLWQRGADAGSSAAMSNLGVSYRDGEGVEQDFAKALGLFRTAALLGDSLAALNAGALFINGQGTVKNPVEGYAWSMLSRDEGAKKNMEIAASRMSPEELENAKARGEELLEQREQNRPAGTAETGTLPIEWELKNGVPVVKGFSSTSGVAGVEIGDILVEIDNKPVTGKTLEEIRNMLRGPVDSIIQLRLSRGDGDVQVATPRVKISDPRK